MDHPKLTHELWKVKIDHFQDILYVEITGFFLSIGTFWKVGINSENPNSVGVYINPLYDYIYILHIYKDSTLKVGWPSIQYMEFDQPPWRLKIRDLHDLPNNLELILVGNTSGLPQDRPKKTGGSIGAHNLHL